MRRRSRPSILICIGFETGKLQGKDRSAGKGTLTYTDGNLYVIGGRSTVGLAEASPSAYLEKSRFEIADQGWPNWAHSVVCGAWFCIRNQGTLACDDIRATQKPKIPDSQLLM